MGDTQTIIRKKWVTGSSNSNSNSNSSSSKWSKHVPDDIMQPILQRLCIFDYVRCSSVCRSWRESVDRAIASRWCRPAPQLPWLLFRFSKFSFRLSKFSLKRQHFIKLSLPNDDEHDDYVGSIEGWLMRVDWTGSIITLLNPISGGRVMLPRCKHEVTAPFISKVVASSVPTTTSPSSLFVACLSTNVERTNLAVCRPTDYMTTLTVCRPTDKSWTQIDEGLSFEDIEFIDGKLYAATNNPSESLIVFQFDTHNHDDQQQQQQQQIQYRAERLVVLHNSGPDRVRFEHIFRINKSRLFLAKDFFASTELLMITFPDNFLEEKLLLCPHDYAEEFQVFKLAFNNNAAANNGRPPPPPRWVEIVGFRDRILFLFQKCMEFSDTINVDTNDLLNTDLIYGIYTCINLLRQRHIWLTPNPW